MLQCVAVCCIVAVRCSVLQCVAVHCGGIVISTHVENIDTQDCCCSVVQYVVVCCSVLQCVEVRCSVLQCVAVCCSVLQCVAVRCSVLQCVAMCCSVFRPSIFMEVRRERNETDHAYE